MSSSGKEELLIENDKSKGESYLGSMSFEMSMRVFHKKLRRGFMDIIGEPTKRMLYRIGKKNGMIIADHFDDLNVISKMGFGVPKIKEDKIIIKNSYISKNYDSEEPVCELLEGVIAGWFSIKEEEDIDYKETKCKAVGNKKCEFEREKRGIEVEKPQMKWEKGKDLKEYKMKWNKNKGEVFYRGSSALILPRGFSSILQKEFERIIGPVSRRRVYEIVKEMTYEALNKELGLYKILLSLPNNIIINPVLNKEMKQLTERGFGNIKVEKRDIENLRFKIVVKNSYNLYGYENEKEPVCKSLGGVLAGGAMALLGGNWESKETKCVGTGDSHCEFVVGQVDKKKKL